MGTLICPECAGDMVLKDAKAGFHFIPHTYTVTTIKVPTCSSCGYMDTESARFKNEVQRAREEFLKKYRALRAETSQGEGATEDSRKKCERCGATARRKEARFCWNCGRPLPHDNLEPAT